MRKHCAGAWSEPSMHADESTLASQAGHTQKGASMRRLWNTASHRIGMVMVLTLFGFGLAAPAAADDQVPFTLNGTGVVTSVTRLPGGLTQVNFSSSGTATHVGNYTAPVTRIQDHQGNFINMAVLIAANGKDTVFFAVSGHSEDTPGSCVVISTGTYTVTGGTGAFANATGSGTFTAQHDPCAGTGTATYEGTISRPNSD